MWPRNDPTFGTAGVRPPKGNSLSGFVAFMKRKDAEDALRQFDGYDWGGSTLRVGWSKAVPVAARPLYGPSSMFPLTPFAYYHRSLDFTARLLAAKPKPERPSFTIAFSEQ